MGTQSILSVGTLVHVTYATQSNYKRRRYFRVLITSVQSAAFIKISISTGLLCSQRNEYICLGTNTFNLTLRHLKVT